MSKLWGFLVVALSLGGCGESSTGPIKDDPLIGIWTGTNGRKTLTLTVLQGWEIQIESGRSRILSKGGRGDEGVV